MHFCLTLEGFNYFIALKYDQKYLSYYSLIQFSWLLKKWADFLYEFSINLIIILELQKCDAARVPSNKWATPTNILGVDLISNFKQIRLLTKRQKKWKDKDTQK